MGVAGLWPLLEPTSSSITLDRLEGKRLAVDISLWLHQAAQGYSSHNLDSKCPHLSLLIQRIAKLLFYKIRPVFVFDGAEVPVFKKQLLRNRALKKHLDEIVSIKQTQKKMLEQVMQENHGDLLDEFSTSASSSETPNSKKKARRSNEEDMFLLPSTSTKLVENNHNESKERTSSSVTDYLEGFETMVSADERMTFLKNAKEKFREERLRVNEIPEESTDFSSFQLKRLVNRNKIHTQMEMLRKEKLAQCVRVSADKMKMVVVDSHLRSHVLLRDDDVQILNSENMEREKLIKESLTWPQFIKQMEQQQKREQETAQQIRDSAKTDLIADEEDDLQQAILSSIAEKNALSCKDFKKLPGYGFSSADYEKPGINEDSWTSESDDSDEISKPNALRDAVSVVSSSSKTDVVNNVEYMSSASDSEESNSEEAEELQSYFPVSKKKAESNTSKEEEDGIYADCQQFLTLLGEAEAQCAELERLNLVDGIISDDSDVWNVFSRSKHVQEYQSKKILKELGLERKEFVPIGILSGGDYTKGFEKVGVVTALELIAEFSKLSDSKADLMVEGFAMLEKISDWLKSKSEFYARNKAGENSERSSFIESSIRIRLRRIIEKNNDHAVISKFPDSAIFDAYANPKVDRSSQRFKWQRVDFERLYDFLRSKLGLSEEKIRQMTHGAFEEWDKFMQGATQVYQTRITSFATSTKHDMGLLCSTHNLEPSVKVRAALKQLKCIKSSKSEIVRGSVSEDTKVAPGTTSQKITTRTTNFKAKKKPSTFPMRTRQNSSRLIKDKNCEETESDSKVSSEKTT